MVSESVEGRDRSDWLSSSRESEHRKRRRRKGMDPPGHAHSSVGLSHSRSLVVVTAAGSGDMGD